MLARNDDIKNKMLLIHDEICRIQKEILNTDNHKKVAKLKMNIKQLEKDIVRMENGYDIELSNKVLQQFDYDNRCDTVESYQESKEMVTDMVYTQVHKTDIIMEYPCGVMWTEYNKNIGDKPGINFYHNGIDQLLYNGHKQVLNIPVYVNPAETFDFETKMLIDLIKKFMESKYEMVAKGAYIVKHRDDIDYNKSDNINMAYIVIPSQCIDNYKHKLEFIQLFREYVMLNNKIYLENRIGFCKLHRHIPNVEIMIPQLTKTISDKTSDIISANKEFGYLTNVDRPIVPVVILSVDNSTSNTSNTNIIGNNNNTVINHANANTTIATNTAMNNHSNIKSKMDKCREFLDLVTKNPPAWHVKGAIVDIRRLYQLYRTTGGTAVTSQFGQFISKCTAIYEKVSSEYIERVKTSKYKIL